MKRVPLRQTEVTIAGIRSPLIEGGLASAEEAVVFVHGNLGGSWERGVAFFAGYDDFGKMREIEVV